MRGSFAVIEPSVDCFLAKPPVLADLLAGHFALLGELVERGLPDLEILRELIDRHHLLWLGRHLHPDSARSWCRTLLVTAGFYSTLGPAADDGLPHSQCEVARKACGSGPCRPSLAHPSEARGRRSIGQPLAGACGRAPRRGLSGAMIGWMASWSRKSNGGKVRWCTSPSDQMTAATSRVRAATMPSGQSPSGHPRGEAGPRSG